MHAILFSAAVFGLLAVNSSFDLSSLPPSYIVIVVAVTVCVVGLPHGADDYRTGQVILKRYLDSRENNCVANLTRALAFITAYMAVAALVVMGWYLLPVVTVLIFFAMSAWHFGSEDKCDVLKGTGLCKPFLFALGGMVIWVPTLFQADAVGNLLDLIIPGSGWEAWLVLEILQPVAICCLAIVVLCLALMNWREKSAWIWLVRIGSLFILFSFADPFIGFAVYFCGWHSAGELIRFVNRNGSHAIVRLIPFTLAAIVCCFAGWSAWYFLEGLTWTESLVRTIFIGLSAVAVPHLMLHLAEESDGPTRRDCVNQMSEVL
jgi:Brp/Blh family beta-carotene 15,15'-monooxygenase